MEDDLDKMLDSVAQMEKPFGVPDDQWAQVQGAAAALKSWKADVTARLAALEAARTPA